MAINRERMMINYRFLAGDLEYTTNHLQHLSTVSSSDRDLELQESDIWSLADSEDSSDFGLGLHRRVPAKTKKTKEKEEEPRTTEVPSVTATVKPSSLPVNVPDWSKILRSAYKDNRWRRDFCDDDDDMVDDRERSAPPPPGEAMRMRRWLPPHELMQARSRTTASFSVHEGMGRTLKGRDLSRVRNAIWAKIGFMD